MTYRSTKDKAEAQKVARELYVTDRLSMEEISEQTGETVKTLRAWRNLGEWETMKEKNAKTELDRLKDLRSSLLDRAEAQLQEGKLPHTEIGLMYKLEKMIERREQQQGLPEMVALRTLSHFGPGIARTSGELKQTFEGILLAFGRSISEQGFSRPSR